MTIHTHFPKGKRVLVIFKNGEKLIDKYLEYKSGKVLLEKNGTINLRKVRSITIYKGI